MAQPGQPDVIDTLQGRLPPLLPWCLAGVGAAAGWYYARTDATPIPLSYVVGGAAVGFCLVAGVFAGLRLFKLLAVAGVVLVVINYAVLIPYGYGDHVPGWIDAGRAAVSWLDPSTLIKRWGKDIEIQPPNR